MELPNCCYRLSVKALVFDENRDRFLVIREDSGKWEFPGGGVDHSADLHQELKREIEEEMHVQVTSIAKEPYYFLVGMNSVGTPTANVFYETVLESLNFQPTEECREIRFVNSAEAQMLKSNENLQIFGKYFGARRRK